MKTDGAVRIRIYVQPRAARTEIAGQYGGLLRVRIAAPASDNAANDALIEFIARTLQVPRRDVRLHSGARSRRKTLEISGLDAARIAQLLQAD